MADEIKIDIYLQGGEELTSQDKVTGTGGNISGMSQAGDSKSVDTTFEKGFSSLRKYVASQTINVFLENAKSAVSTNIGIATGKQELQQKVNFAMNTVQETVKTATNAFAGSTITAMMGLGGGIGAVLGIALSAVSGVINYSFKASNLNISTNLENRQIRESQNRMGAIYNRSRSGV